jgi:hypothetical protein
MKKVRVRRIRRRQDTEEEPRRVPKGLYWAILAVILIIVVWQYDQGEQRVAQQHVRQAESLVGKADYTAAIAEFRSAMDNPRLTRQKKAELAIKIAQLYDEKLDDPVLALTFYNRARTLHQRTTDRPEIKARMAALRERIAAGGEASLLETEETTGAVQEVRLLAPPPEDLQGRPIAQVGDVQINAGAFARFVRQKTRTPAAALQPNDPKLDQWLEEFLDRELAFRAAVARQIHLQPGIISQLYDYQRVVLSQQLLAEEREKIRLVTDEEVRQYYEKNHDRFVVPERITLGAVAATTESAIADAKRLLAQHAPWQDIVTSCATLPEITERDGLLGTITPADKSLPVLGEVPGLLDELRRLREGETTGPIKLHDAYWLFVALKTMPREEKSLDEVRPQIETTLRSEKLAHSEQDLRKVLREKYKLNVLPDAKTQIVEYMRQVESETSSPVASKKEDASF